MQYLVILILVIYLIILHVEIACDIFYLVHLLRQVKWLLQMKL